MPLTQIKSVHHLQNVIHSLIGGRANYHLTKAINMNNEQQLELIKDEINKEYTDFHHKEHARTGSEYQFTFASFTFNKLAEYELRIRNLEKGNNDAQAYLSLHTPLM